MNFGPIPNLYTNFNFKSSSHEFLISYQIIHKQISLAAHLTSMNLHLNFKEQSAVATSNCIE